MGSWVDELLEMHAGLAPGGLAGGPAADQGVRPTFLFPCWVILLASGCFSDLFWVIVSARGCFSVLCFDILFGSCELTDLLSLLRFLDC